MRPETERRFWVSTAIKIIEDIKPFVVINDDALSRSAYNMAAALNAKAPASSRPIHQTSTAIVASAGELAALLRRPRHPE